MTVNGRAQWSSILQDDEIGDVVELTPQGKSVREIADETGISKSKVQRLQRIPD